MEPEEIVAETERAHKNEFADLLIDPNIYCLVIYALMLCFMFFGCNSRKSQVTPDVSNTESHDKFTKVKKERY